MREDVWRSRRGPGSWNHSAFGDVVALGGIDLASRTGESTGWPSRTAPGHGKARYRQTSLRLVTPCTNSTSPEMVDGAPLATGPDGMNGYLPGAVPIR